MFANVRIVCPRCRSRSEPSERGGRRWQTVECWMCHTRFEVLAVCVQAVALGLESAGTVRSVSIAARLSTDQPTLVEFSDSGREELQLRRGDEIIVSRWNGNVRIVQNLSLDESYDVLPPRRWLVPSAIIVTGFCGLVVVAAFVMTWVLIDP